jgi:hypothetical protein
LKGAFYLPVHSRVVLVLQDTQSILAVVCAAHILVTHTACRNSAEVNVMGAKKNCVEVFKNRSAKRAASKFNFKLSYPFQANAISRM